MKQYEVLQRASLFLQKNNCEPKIAEILLQHHLSMDQAKFLINMRETIPEDILLKFKTDVKQHVTTKVPVQHLVGYEYFYGRKFTVNKHTLIPRPETEELVQLAIDQIRSEKLSRAKIVDVGTGSGVIAITLALELSQAKVYGTDISRKALQVAEMNAEQLGAEVHFRHGNFLQPFLMSKQKVEIIISNPPYISYKEKSELSVTVKEHDPEIALFAKKDGLAAYETIVAQAKEVLNHRGMLLFEIGHKQGEAVSSIVSDYFPKAHVRILQDMNQLDRIVFAQM